MASSAQWANGSVGCAFGKGKSGNAESKPEAALVPLGAGFILNMVSELYWEEREKECVCVCVYVYVCCTGFLNMQILFSESSLCNQLSDGPSLAQQIPGKVRKQKLPELGWPGKTQLGRCADSPP